MDIVNGLRKVMQELLVPELRAIQTELKHHSEQFEQIDKRFEQMEKRFEQIDKRFELLFKELYSIKESLGEINAKLDLSQRLSRVEGAQEEMRREFMDRLFAKSALA